MGNYFLYKKYKHLKDLFLARIFTINMKSTLQYVLAKNQPQVHL